MRARCDRDSPGRGMASGRVLAVEDEADLVATYKRLLRRYGYRVVAAGSREAGLAALKDEPPRLLIADLRLPDGDGLDVVRTTRAPCPRRRPSSWCPASP
jgi:DNA-binding response OmpR family regulator